MSRFIGQYRHERRIRNDSFFDLLVEPGGISGRYTGNGSDCDSPGTRARTTEVINPSAAHQNRHRVFDGAADRYLLCG